MVRSFSINEMCNIQNYLNNITVGDDWQKQLTPYDFQAAAFDELSELLRTYNWKWWNNKAKEEHHWNAAIEIVDILHFLLSIKVMMNHQTDRDDVFVIGSRNINKNDNNKTFIHHESRNEIRELVTYIGKLIGMFDNESPNGKSILLDNIVQTLPLSEEMASAIYQAKATLNEIRQDSGYKTDKYNKYAKGKEDNEVLKEVVGAFRMDDNMSLDDVRESVINEFKK